MIYTESFRHFVQEWFLIEAPNRYPDWPWGRKNIYLLNLYAISGDDEKTKATMPDPFISILLDDIDDLHLIGPEFTLYKGYFSRPQFKLPRKYLLDLSSDSDAPVFKVNRYTFTSEGGERAASDWDGADLTLAQELARREHIRRYCLSSKVYQQVQNRLEHLGRKSNFHVRYADNLLDCTEVAKNQVKGRKGKRSPQTFLIQAPIAGMLSPIRKARDYRLINGVLSIADDPVTIALPKEMSYDAYLAETIPFRNVGGKNGSTIFGTFNTTKFIVYLVVESHNGFFSFQEYFPKLTIRVDDIYYARMISHNFSIKPVQKPDKRVAVTLGHELTEGLLPSIGDNYYYLRKKSDEKLFVKTDMPMSFVRKGDEINGPAFT